MKKLFVMLLIISSHTNAEDIFTNEFETLIATRVNALSLMDPHLFTDFFGCNDITDTLNGILLTQIEQDGDGDGFLDTSLNTQFNTDQPQYINSKSLSSSLINGLCIDSLTCTTGVVAVSGISTEANQVDSCLATIDGTTSGYSPAVESTQAPCYSTAPVSTTLILNGINIELEDYQQAARYSGGLTLDQGLHRGFISEAVAQTIEFPNDVPLVGGQTLFDLLPGGNSCSEGDDRDLGPDGLTSGWWFYFNSQSDLVLLESN
ncbi:hypothetical protein OS175_06080 [Marinicella sp. S1101]|uniref:hypothetical protein n=1 Tax=Marinicella marina TaxID=2996016 RepID=UPI002260F0BB|nr:hypothetical protein [Marinicella marina]MCX7553440.1 hypothetical protein [Marinicella marina]MDJ1140064.1 hypothetical protein [Marinicella marina]